MPVSIRSYRLRSHRTEAGTDEREVCCGVGRRVASERRGTGAGIWHGAPAGSGAALAAVGQATPETAHSGLILSVHTSRSGSRRSGSPWMTKIFPRADPRAAGLRSRSRGLGGRGFGVDARVADADGHVRAPGDHPHGNRPAPRRRVSGVDPEGGERRIQRALEYRHQMHLPLLSTRGRVQIGSELDCTCSMTQRANC
jgi:hypothetical protein